MPNEVERKGNPYADITWIKDTLGGIAVRLTRLEDAVNGFKDSCRQRHEVVDSKISTVSGAIVDKLEAQNNVQNDRLLKIESDLVGTKARQAVIIFIICTTIAVLSFLSTISWFRGTTLDEFHKQIENMRKTDADYSKTLQDLKARIPSLNKADPPKIGTE